MPGRSQIAASAPCLETPLYHVLTNWFSATATSVTTRINFQFERKFDLPRLCVPESASPARSPAGRSEMGGSSPPGPRLAAPYHFRTNLTILNIMVRMRYGDTSATSAWRRGHRAPRAPHARAQAAAGTRPGQAIWHQPRPRPRVLDRLEAKGLVVRHQGSGTYAMEDGSAAVAPWRCWSTPG